MKTEREPSPLQPGEGAFKKKKKKKKNGAVGGLPGGRCTFP